MGYVRERKAEISWSVTAAPRCTRQHMEPTSITVLRNARALSPNLTIPYTAYIRQKMSALGTGRHLRPELGRPGRLVASVQLLRYMYSCCRVEASRRRTSETARADADDSINGLDVGFGRGGEHERGRAQREAVGVGIGRVPIGTRLVSDALVCSERPRLRPRARSCGRNTGRRALCTGGTR